MISRIVSLLLILTISPILIFLSIFILIFDGRPILFRQERIGFKNKTFKIYKFRTMSNGTPDIPTHLIKNEGIKYTFMGKFLRKYSLDEIPQLFNILLGNMSFVGPRPIVKDEICKYGSSFNLYKSCKPGLTGLWQVSGRNNTSYQERVDYDSYYVKNRSLLLDFKILLKTIPVVLSKKGAY